MFLIENRHTKEIVEIDSSVFKSFYDCYEDDEFAYPKTLWCLVENEEEIRECRIKMLMKEMGYES